MEEILASIRRIIADDDATKSTQPAPEAPKAVSADDPIRWGKTGRNEPCPCGSGKKFKHCHGYVGIVPPATVAIIKCGVVEDTPYTLYSDGSIEAQLPQGTLRFDSITELRKHIESS